MRLQEQLPPIGDYEFLERLVDERTAAAFVGYSPRALQNWRLRGGGPQYIRVSARSIRYRRRDLIQWAEQHLRSSTTEGR